MAIQAWKAALAWRAERWAARLPGGALYRYVLAAVPVARMPAPAAAPAAAGPIDPAAAVAAGLTDAAAARWRVAQGMDCLGAHRQRALVAVTWIGAGGFDEDECHLRFLPPPGAAWDTGMAIAPAARGGRAFAALWGATRAWAEARGLDWSISRIAAYNLASRRAHARLGGVEIGSVSVFEAAGWQWTPGARPALSRIGGPRPLVTPALPR